MKSPSSCHKPKKENDDTPVPGFSFGTSTMSSSAALVAPAAQPLFPAHASYVTISKPSVTNILFGRGKPIENHPGNRTYRKVIQSKSVMYDAAKTNLEKKSITLSIVHEMKEQLHHQFLKEDEKTGLWIEVTDVEIARQKVVNALLGLRKKGRHSKPKYIRILY